MQMEDCLSQCLREKDKSVSVTNEAAELKIMLVSEKERWLKGVNDQKRKLEHLVEEKKE